MQPAPISGMLFWRRRIMNLVSMERMIVLKLMRINIQRMRTRPGVWLAPIIAGALVCASIEWRTRAAVQDLTVTASFAAESPVTPQEQIEFKLSRGLEPSEGRLAVLIGQTDLTTLFKAEELSL